MQIKTIMRYSYTAFRLAETLKSDHTKCWWECGDTGWWERNMVQTFWKTGWQFLKNLILQLPNVLVMKSVGIYPRKVKTYIHTQNPHKNVYSKMLSSLQGVLTSWGCLIHEDVFVMPSQGAWSRGRRAGEWESGERTWHMEIAYLWLFVSQSLILNYLPQFPSSAVLPFPFH